ncbi:heme peroxidase [Mycena olivaceomarginata]|nr:heme peroxidase [Mycena olivaceomarginata]
MFTLALFAYLATANAYIWPSPQLDALESLRFPVEFSFIPSFLEPCGAFTSPAGDGDEEISGRSNAADWIRTAYHDMATHNVVDGTGGMDASIRFAEEQARPENAGNGFSNTLSVLTQVSSHGVSVADLLALGLVLAIEKCGGPQIAFRGGRIDAEEPNIPGVPEPQQDLDSHIASFARQGFTKEEMIGLVACGHTFGGVQHDPFPDIVPELNDPHNVESVAHFDSTSTSFDNNIATEYINGTTLNPLVVGTNATTNSDQRIFGSDGNVTMLSFAKSPQHFASTCADLFARMIDTPQLQPLTIDGDILQFAGLIRFWNLTENPDRVVQIVWDDHVGGIHNQTLLPSQEITPGNFMTWYDLRPTEDVEFLSLDATAGITNMRFTLDGKLEDQGGVGFAVQDALVFSTTSCRTSTSPPAAKFDVAVRKGANVTRMYTEDEVKDATGHGFLVERYSFSPVEPGAATNTPYAFWTANLTQNATSYVTAEIGGAKISVGPIAAFLALPSCPKL